jgi:outer membrane protein TolC
MTSAMPTLSPRRAALALLAAATTLALLGCADHNPFQLHANDHAKKIPAQRLRELAATDFGNYRKPPQPAPSNSDANDARSRFEKLENIDLTLEQCRQSALEHNLDLKVALLDPTIATERISQEEARFESAFTFRSGWNEFDTPTASQLSSGKSQQQFIEPGVRVPLITGGTASVTLPINRNNNDNSFSTLNPAFTSDLQFSISHELLRGAGRRANTAALRIAGYNQNISEAQTKLEVIRQLAAVDRAYWRLYQARRELEVRQQQYELANDQLARAERRVRGGAAGEIEIVRAQAGLADRLEAIIIAQNNVLDQQRVLKRIINTPGLTMDTQTMVTPTTPPDPVEYAFDRAALTQVALDNRMEMLELELRLAADAAQIALSKNQALPLLTLDYTYRINGLGASTQDSFRMLERNKFEDWQLGLNAEVPLGNEAARSRIREAILTRMQRLGSREARATAITQEVLSAMDAIDAGWQRILAARQSVILNTRTLQAEQRQFEVGNSTSTNVLDAATRLAESQSSEIRALTDYQIAQVDLAFATGTLLGAGKVRWEPASKPGHDEATPVEELPSVPTETNAGQ